MKRKFSSPPLVADGRKRKKSRRSDGTELLDLLTGKKPVVPHLLVTEVSYTPPCHNPSKLAFNRRGVVVAVPLDGAETTVGKARHPSAAIRRRGRLADLYRRCVSFIGATPDGRLAFAGSKGVFLVNPVTDALQRVDTVGCCQKAVIAAAGGSGGHGSGCSLFVSLGALVAPPTLWRLDDDGEGWSKFAVAATAEQTGDVVSAVDCNGSFYLLHEDGTVSKVYAGEPAVAPLRMEKLPVASLADNFSPSCYNKTLAGGEGHLLECDGEVLFVRKLLAAKEIPAPFCAHAEFVGVVGFEVYRLDVAARRWTKIDRLPGGGGGGTAIFVSPESAFAVRTTTMMMSNCVYFAGETRCCYACHVYGGSTWGAYSMERREVLFEHAVESRGGRTEALWFLPNA